MKSVKNGEGRELARLTFLGKNVFITRMPCCTIGEYFCVLSYLMDEGYDIL